MVHYIYIPGLGDRSDFLRRLALQRWKRKDTRVTFVPMRWANKHETYEQKYQRIAHIIEQARGDVITLVGESAGGAMALLAFSRHSQEVSRVITICGYNQGAKDVHPSYRTRRPAFYHVMPLVDQLVARLTPKQRQQITTIYSKNDLTVTPRHSRIADAHEIVLHTPGHFTNIARVLLGKYPLKQLDMPRNA